MAPNFAIRSSLLIVAATAAAGCSMFWQVPETPLHSAAHRGDVAMIRALVEAGSDVNETDSLGHTALAWAARGGHRLGPHQCGDEAAGRPETVAALLALGADPNIQDTRPKGFGRSSGWTPLFVALHHRRGATPNSPALRTWRRSRRTAST